MKQNTPYPFRRTKLGQEIAKILLAGAVTATSANVAASPNFTPPLSLLLNGAGDNNPTFVDIDADGDWDAFVGEFSGNTVFLENTGTNTNPSFAAPQTNPFNLADVGSNSVPTFVDIDNDGDFDAFIGASNGNTYFFENTGTPTSPNFAALQTNPFNLAAVGSRSSPTFVDIDGDGDFDAFIGEREGNTYFFENTGTNTTPNFAAPQINPFNLAAAKFGSSPTFVDIDGDGDFDAFIGEGSGDTLFFENTGTNTSPSFATPQTNPFNLAAGAPTFVDIDSDGDFDAFIGDSKGDIRLFWNTGTNTSPNFALPTNPFNLADVGSNSSPTFVDIDDDGDFDAFIGAYDGDTLFFENTGTNTSQSFAAPQTNPFNLAKVWLYSNPTFVDIDGDGDLDAFIGADFFENTGTNTTPNFAAPQTNPFNLAIAWYNSCPTFVDIDGDGDFDAFVGELYANIYFFENTGTNTTPNFAAPQGYPFNLVGVDLNMIPTFVDIDRDGDLDAFIGGKDGNTYFFSNTGTPTSPNFASPQPNPFNLRDVGQGSAPSFVDIDSDGDFDAFIGAWDGYTYFFENNDIDIEAWLNKTTYQVGDKLQFDVTVSSGKMVDLYVGVIFPDGHYQTIVYPLAFSEINVLQAYKTGVQLTGGQSFRILSLELPAIPSGDYQVCGLLTKAQSSPYDMANWLKLDCKGFHFQ